MKPLLTLALIVLISCNTDKRNSVDDSLNPDLIGIYEYQTADPAENHYIVIDIQQDKYTVFYFGTEDGSGHGIYHYGNELADVEIKDGQISFHIEKRELYPATRFMINKGNNKEEKEEAVGISKGSLNYQGEITPERIILSCQSDLGHCWAEEMEFVRVKGEE